MSTTTLPALRESITAGERMYRQLEELYPICRSITGEGLRETLRRVQSCIPLVLHEVPTGTSAFDWTIPQEWNIRDAWVKNAQGEKVIDFQQSSLHLLNYSVPVRRRMTLAELRPHLHSLPQHPDWIPYRTSYYQENWGFCLTHRQLESLPEGEYEVCIDSTLTAGSMTYGECYLPGRRREEVLFSCHACHPSLANDNLSGVVLMTALAEELAACDNEYSYRFLFLPGTIGSITWLSRNEDRAAQIRHGLVVACVGDEGKFHYKRSRRENAAIDIAAEHILRHSGQSYEVCDFSPYGYDERQYCSPGFNLPVGSLTRTPHGRYPQYHTSADNLDFVSPMGLGGSLEMYLAIVDVLEHDQCYVNLQPKCEPQLGRRGLYQALGGFPDAGQLQLAMLWVLNYSDGTQSLLEIAERAKLEFSLVRRAADALLSAELLATSSAPKQR